MGGVAIGAVALGAAALGLVGRGGGGGRRSLRGRRPPRPGVSRRSVSSAPGPISIGTVEALGGEIFRKLGNALAAGKAPGAPPARRDRAGMAALGGRALRTVPVAGRFATGREPNAAYSAMFSFFASPLIYFVALDVVDLLGHVLEHHAGAVVELRHALQIRLVIERARGRGGIRRGARSACRRG